MYFSSLQSGAVSHQWSGKIASVLFRAIRPAITFIRDNKIWAITSLLDDVVRKTAHIAIYFLITLFVALGVRGFTSNKAVVVAASFLFVLGMACLDEFIQLFSDGRHAKLIDVAMDMLGAGLAYLAILFFCLVRRCVDFFAKAWPTRGSRGARH